MEITRKIPTMKYRVPRPDGTSVDTELTITPYFVSSIEELVKSNRMCVCIHHTLSDYRYQILGNKYDELSPIDVIGNLKSFDNGTMEVVINIDDSHFEEGDSRYIDASKIDKYNLFMRSKSSIHHKEDGAPDDNLEVHIDRIIGFDLVYIDEDDKEKYGDKNDMATSN